MKAFYYHNGMDKRVLSVKQQENIMNTYVENKDRIDPIVDIKVLHLLLKVCSSSRGKVSP